MLKKGALRWCIRLPFFLLQQQLFEIADVQYDLRAKVILKMRAEQKAEAEAWLTENLNQQIELEQEGTEFAEVAL